MTSGIAAERDHPTAMVAPADVPAGTSALHDPHERRCNNTQPAGYTSRRSAAQRDSSRRFDSCSLRSTDDTCVSTVLPEMNSSTATSL